MQQIYISTVTKLEIVPYQRVQVTLDNGIQFTSSSENSPDLGQKIRVDFLWGDDYTAPVVSIARKQEVN